MKRDEKNQLIKNTLFNIKDLLAGDDDYLLIPDYQRGFAWDNEFVTFLDDIKNFRINSSNNNSKQYYLSMITINECIDEKQKEKENLLGKNVFYVVDGQQRVTSLIIIIVSMLQMIEKEDKNFSKLNEYKKMLKIDEENEIYSFSYSNNRQDKSKDFFIDYIYKNLRQIPQDKYSNYIKQARLNLQERLDKLDIVEIERILVDLVENFVFTVYYIEEEKFDVRISFETMNNRGKQLSNLEKLKNRLLYLTQYIQEINDSNRLKNQINKTWANIYDNLSHKNEMLSDDDFLKAHYFIYFRVDKESGNKYFTELMNREFSFDYNDKFRNFSDGEKFNYINNYLKSLGNYSRYFKLVSICEPNNISITDEELKWLKQFRRLESSLYIKSFLMFFINKIDNQAKRFEFYTKFEQYIFIKKYINYKEIAQLSIDTFITCLKNQDTNNIDELIQKTVLDENLVKNYLISFFEKFTNTEKSPNLFYNWDDGLRYFLYQYNEILSGTDDISWDTIEKTSIEHVLPQTPNTEYWITAFENYINDNEKMNIITNMIGNFILLKNTSQNSKLSNYSYPIKRGTDLDNNKDARRFSYVDGTKSQKLLTQSNLYKYWTLEQIIERTKTLFEFLYSTWLKDYMNKEEFNEIVYKDYINNLVIKNEKDYTYLYGKLDAINLESEKCEAYKNCDIQKSQEDDKVVKLRRYFSLENYQINKTQIKYLDNKFTGKYQNNEQSFHFRYSKNNEKVDIFYAFKDNKMVIENGENISEINDFIKSFDRYLVRAGFQTEVSTKDYKTIDK